MRASAGEVSQRTHPDHAQVDDLDPLAAEPAAVGVRVGGVEGLADRLDPGVIVRRGGQRNSQLVPLADVPTVGGQLE